MNLTPTIKDDYKPAIRAVLMRLRNEAFAGDRQKTSAFLRACLGDFGVPEILQEGTLSAILGQLKAGGLATTTSPTQPAGSGPILYLPATCGWFNATGEQMLDAIFRVAKLSSDAGVPGRIGLCFEVTGSTGNLGVKTKDFKHAYAQHCLEIVITAGQCVARGVPLKIDGINSNDFGKGWSASWKDTKENRAFIISETTKLAKDLLPYADWLIVQPVAENDSAMKSDFRDAVRRAWLAAGWKSSRLAGPGKAGGAGINEIHISGVKKSATTGKNDLVTTDNPDGILAHFEGGGGVWSEHKPKVSACILSAKAHLSRGTSFALYHRSQELHIVDHQEIYKQIIEDVSDILRAAGPTPTIPSGATAPTSTPASSSGAVLLEVKKSSKDKYIDFRYSGIEDWQEKKDSKGNLKGWIVLNGVRVEQFRVGYTKQHLNNAYGHDEHGVRGIKTGDTVSVSLQSTDLKHKTNSLPFTWPWGNT